MSKILFALACTLLLANAAVASPLVVAEFATDRYDVQDVTYSFGSRGGHERVDVAVQFADREICRDVPTSYCNPVAADHFKVEGLRFENNKVIYTHDGHETVCATVTWRHFLFSRYAVYQPVGCTLEETQAMDHDGRAVTQVLLNVTARD